MVCVFTYDVVDDRRRRRVAAILEKHAVRVQKSVFEARMPPARAHRIADRVIRELGPEDSLRLYAIGAHGQTHCRVHGSAPLPEAQEFWLL